MVHKQIPVADIKSFMGSSFYVNKRDEDGRVLFEEGKGAKLPEPVRSPQKIKATTLLLLEDVMLSIPADIQAPKDGKFVPQVWNALVRVEEAMAGSNGHSPEVTISLREPAYKWLHGLLERNVPFNKDTIEMNKTIPDENDRVKPFTFARVMWGLNWWTLTRQLMTDADRDSADAEEEEEKG